MQRLLEIPQEVYDFLRDFRLRAGDLNRDSPGCLLLPPRYCIDAIGEIPNLLKIMEREASI